MDFDPGQLKKRKTGLLLPGEGTTAQSFVLLLLPV
jgi:hypothetical protein